MEQTAFLTDVNAVLSPPCVYVTEVWLANVSDTVNTALNSTYNCTSGVSIDVGTMTLTMNQLTVGAFMNATSSGGAPKYLKTGRLIVETGRCVRRRVDVSKDRLVSLKTDGCVLRSVGVARDG